MFIPVSWLCCRYLYNLFCFLGGKDRRGGPIIWFPAKSRAFELDRISLTRLLVYLASIPRFVKYSSINSLLYSPILR